MSKRALRWQIVLGLLLCAGIALAGDQGNTNFLGYVQVLYGKLRLFDSDGSHYVTVRQTSNLTTNTTLDIDMVGGSRVVHIPDEATISGVNTGDQDLSGYVATSRTVSTNAPLTGGGALSSNLVLSISPATTSTAGSMSAADKTKLDLQSGTNTGDQDLSGYVPNTRTITAGTGLTGGGDLSANRSFAVSYGTTSGTAAEGNDSRFATFVSGTGSTTDNKLVRWNGTSGTSVQTSLAELDDSGNFTVPALATFDGVDVSVLSSTVGVHDDYVGTWIWRPTEASPSGRTYSDFTLLWAAVTATEGPQRIVIDDTTFNYLDIPAGSYDFENRIWFESTMQDSSYVVYPQFASGATASHMKHVGQAVQLSVAGSGSTPAIDITSGDSPYYVVFDGVQSGFYGDGTRPLFQVESGATLWIIITGDFNSLYRGAGGPLVHVKSGGTAILYWAGIGAYVESGVATGEVGATLSTYFSPFTDSAPSFPGFLGTITTGYYGNASFLKYTATTPANWSSTPATAGAAFDNLASTRASMSASFTQFTNVPTDRLVGRDTAGTGAAELLTVGGGLEFTGSAGIQRSALTGDVTASAGSNATTIATSAVTLSKMADLAQDQFIGRTSASTGVPQTATITAAARTLLDDTSTGAIVTTLGLFTPAYYYGQLVDGAGTANNYSSTTYTAIIGSGKPWASFTDKVSSGISRSNATFTFTTAGTYEVTTGIYGNLTSGYLSRRLRNLTTSTTLAEQTSFFDGGGVGNGERSWTALIAVAASDQVELQYAKGSAGTAAGYVAPPTIDSVNVSFGSISITKVAP